MAEEEDARSEESFQSADDDDDDFDLPQDVSASGGGAPGLGGGGAMPPGLDDGGEGTERWNLRKDGNREELEPIIQRLSMEKEHIKISKMFSYVLRHAAHKLDVRIRKDGFVRLREIMKLRNFRPYSLEELMAVVYFDEKERYTMVREFDGELLIRANQGHTMKVIESELLLDLVEDPELIAECVHGTYLVHWPFIKRQGLSKVARNHIHLANGLPEDGKIRGMRSTAELFVYVDVPRAMEDGVIFYRSKNDVILTVGLDGWLPVKYFQKAVRIDYNTCEIEEMEYDRELDVPRWAAELAPTGPGEEGTYVVKNLEALIGNCRKRLADINDIKAHQENGNELTEEEQEKISKHAQVYTELQSLEQRFRQHKGHRRESAQEKEQRAREEAEAGTIVTRKDRASTPPWEKNRKNDTEALSAANRKVSEKEKAEWAAIGKRRENAAEQGAAAPTKQPSKKEDPWESMGRARQTAPTPTAAGSRNLDDDDDFLAKRFSRKDSLKDEEPSWRREEKPEQPKEPSWRREEKPESKSKVPEESPTGAAGGRPRFFNSKKNSDGPSWRDRMAGGGAPAPQTSAAREPSPPEDPAPAPAAPSPPPVAPDQNLSVNAPTFMPGPAPVQTGPPPTVYVAQGPPTPMAAPAAYLNTAPPHMAGMSVNAQPFDPTASWTSAAAAGGQEKVDGSSMGNFYPSYGTGTYNAGYNQGGYAEQRPYTQQGSSGGGNQNFDPGYYGGGQRQGLGGPPMQGAPMTQHGAPFQAGQQGYPNAGQPGYPNAGQPGYPNAGQPGFPNAGQSGFSNAGQPGYANAGQPGYANGNFSGFANANSGFATSPPSFDARGPGAGAFGGRDPPQDRGSQSADTQQFFQRGGGGGREYYDDADYGGNDYDDYGDGDADYGQSRGSDYGQSKGSKGRKGSRGGKGDSGGGGKDFGKGSSGKDYSSGRDYSSGKDHSSGKDYSTGKEKGSKKGGKGGGRGKGKSGDSGKSGGGGGGDDDGWAALGRLRSGG